MREETKIGMRISMILLTLAMFATGAAGIIYEYILGTVSSYILGNSVEQFSIVIGMMLLLMGIGGLAQRNVSDENLIEKFVIVEAILAVLGGFAPIAIYSAFGFMEDHFTLILYFFIAVIGFLVGFEIPLTVRINQKYLPKIKENVGWIFFADYAGSFIGTLVWVLYLLKKLPLTESGFVVAGINLSIAVITFAYFRGREFGRKQILSAVATTVAAVLIIVGYTHNRSWEMNLQQRLYEDPVVFTKTTKYQHLVMTKRTMKNGVEDLRLFINGNTQFSSVDEMIYHEQLVHPVVNLAASHKKVLVLGGGDGLAVRELVKYRDIESITLVDLDPEMIELARTNPVMRQLNGDAFADARVITQAASVVKTDQIRKIYEETGRSTRDKTEEKEKVAEVQVYTIDADKFVAGVEDQWDVVIIDFPDPNAVELAKLYSREFFLKLQRLLTPEGMFVIQSASPYHAKEAYLCILRTIRSAGYSALPYHDNVPSFGDWGWVLAWKDGYTPPMKDLEIPVTTRYLTPDVFRAAMIFGRGSLESKHQEINTLMYPVLLQFYLDEGWLEDA